MPAFPGYLRSGAASATAFADGLTQYFGRASGGNGTLSSTEHATKGKLFLNAAQTIAVDEGSAGLGSARLALSPAGKLLTGNSPDADGLFTQWEHTPLDPLSKKFRAEFQEFTDTGHTRKDCVYAFGYNVQVGSIAQDASDVAFGTWVESCWLPPGSEQVEYYLQGRATNGTSVRPFGVTFKHATGATDVNITADQFSLDRTDNGVQEFFWSPGQYFQFAVPLLFTEGGLGGGIVAGVLSLAAPQTSLGGVKLYGGSTPRWSMTRNASSNDLYFTDDTNGRTHLLLQVGSSDLIASTELRSNASVYGHLGIGGSYTTSASLLVTINSNGVKGLVITGAASQASNLLEFNDSGGNNLIALDSAGRIYHKNSSAPGGAADYYTQYAADQAAGNSAPHFRTENGSVIVLFKTGTYTPTNVTTDRSYDANSTTVDELADVLGTLLADLQLTGLIG